MTETTRNDIANLIALLRAAYPNYRPEKETASVFHKLLADLPRELLEAAVEACIEEPGRAFAPSVGEIRGRAVELRRQAAGVPTALEALQEVLDMPADRDSHTIHWRDGDGNWVYEVRRRRFSHPFVGKVARDLGWPSRFPGDLPNADRALFLRVYEMQLEKGYDRHTLPLDVALAGDEYAKALLEAESDSDRYETIFRAELPADLDDEAPTDQ